MILIVAVTRMINDEFVVGDKIAVIGLSRGAELALEVASHNANVGLTIALSPSSIRQAGWVRITRSRIPHGSEMGSPSSGCMVVTDLE